MINNHIIIGSILFFASPSPARAGVVVNEVAWGGTAAGASHEWIELFNGGDEAVSLAGWRLRTASGGVNVGLSGTLAPAGYFLLERSSDKTILDLPADLVYTGGLSNGGEDLFLLDASSSTVDALPFGGGWPAGTGAPDYRSMERVDPAVPASAPGNWRSNDGITRDGQDAQGAPLNGTPKALNAAFGRTAPGPGPALPPAPSAPREVVINEVAWGGTAAGASNEWIELFNNSTRTVVLDGWRLGSGDGDVLVPLSGSLPPSGFYLMERTSDADVSDVTADAVYTGSLSNGGEDLFLLDAASGTVDSARFAGGWPAGSGAPAFASMERVWPGSDGDAPDNWRSNDGVTRNGLDAKGGSLNGTPGRRNAAYGVFPSAGGGSLSSAAAAGPRRVFVDPAANPFSPRDPDPARRAARILFNAGSPEAAKTLRIADVRGEVVRSFSEADGLAGAGAGTVLWDGKDGDGRALPPGIYAVYFEAVDPASGARVRGKDRVVLGYPR